MDTEFKYDSLNRLPVAEPQQLPTNMMYDGQPENTFLCDAAGRVHVTVDKVPEMEKVNLVEFLYGNAPEELTVDQPFIIEGN